MNPEFLENPERALRALLPKAIPPEQPDAITQRLLREILAELRAMRAEMPKPVTVTVHTSDPLVSPMLSTKLRASFGPPDHEK